MEHHAGADDLVLRLVKQGKLQFSRPSIPNLEPHERHNRNIDKSSIAPIAAEPNLIPKSPNLANSPSRGPPPTPESTERSLFPPPPYTI
jgi:hypothetical protein